MAKKTGTAGADSLIGTAKADELFGLAGKDVLKGSGGNDYLDGGTGDDDLQGGAGNDIYIVDHVGDINKKLTDAGQDTVGALISYALGAQQENITLLGKSPLTATGNNLANLMNGNDGANILMGLGGNDVLDGRKGVDDLRGGAGDDLYFIDNAREINKALLDAGKDQVQSGITYALGAFQESLILRGTGAISGTGNAGANFIQGNDAANGIRGLDGNDILVGAKGNDLLVGGAGGDQLSGQGDNDTLSGEAGNDQLLGGIGNDVLFGGDGDDFLNGEAGRDALHGGSGNDIYRLDGSLSSGVAIDTAAEIDNGSDPGIDTVQVNFDYTLGAQQENIVFYGSSAHVGIGNASDNDLRGTNLAGDELFGLGGKDKLFGGAGDDHLVGGEGDDEYFIDNAGDIHEADDDAGRDTVNSSITYTLLAKQEDLVLLSSTSELNGTGNGSANVIFGNSGGNVLHGLAGDDQLIGGGGHDSLFGDEGNDILHYNPDGLTDVIDGGVGASDALYLVGTTANVTLDLTTVADTVIKDIEIIRFASNAEAVNQSHELTLNAGDVLAISSSTDFLEILGEADDTVHLTGGGWTKDTGTFLNTFQGYTNGAAHVLVGLNDAHELAVTVTLS